LKIGLSQRHFKNKIKTLYSTLEFHERITHVYKEVLRSVVFVGSFVDWSVRSLTSRPPAAMAGRRAERLGGVARAWLRLRLTIAISSFMSTLHDI